MADDQNANESPPRRSLAGSAGLVSFATSLSRLGGLVREQLFASLLGAGMYSDAFVVAFRVPNLLRDLLAEGAWDPLESTCRHASLSIL